MSAINDLVPLAPESEQDVDLKIDTITEPPKASVEVESDDSSVTPAESLVGLLEDILEGPVDDLDEKLLNEVEQILIDGQDKEWAEFEDCEDSLSDIGETLIVRVES